MALHDPLAVLPALLHCCGGSGEHWSLDTLLLPCSLAPSCSFFFFFRWCGWGVYTTPVLVGWSLLRSLPLTAHYLSPALLFPAVFLHLFFGATSLPLPTRIYRPALQGKKHTQTHAIINLSTRHAFNSYRNLKLFVCVIQSDIINTRVGAQLHCLYSSPSWRTSPDRQRSQHL